MCVYMSQYFCNYYRIIVITTSPPTRTQARVTPNKKSTQTTQPIFPSKGKIQKEEIITTLKPGKRRPQMEQVGKKIKRWWKDREIQYKWKSKVETHKTK